MFGPLSKKDGLNSAQKKLFLKIQSGEASPEELARYTQLKKE